VLSACAARNEPNVHLAEELPNQARWHGAELSVTILGNWQYYRAKILRQAALLYLVLGSTLLHACLRRLLRQRTGSMSGR
jgi:hypothetical protein